MPDREGRSVIRHGTQSAYNWWKCRCAECTEANRLSSAAYLAENRARVKARRRTRRAHLRARREHQQEVNRKT